MVNPIYAKKTVDGIYVSKAIIVVVGLFWIEIAGFVGELVVYWFLKQTRYHNGQPGKLTELVEPGVELGGLLENQLGMQTQYHNGQRLTERIAGFAGELVERWFWTVVVQCSWCSFVSPPVYRVSPLLSKYVFRFFPF